MKIQYLGHACFKLISGDDSLIIDPYADDSVDGFGHLREEAIMVIYSHKHADHYGVDCVKLIDGDESKFKVDFIQSWHDDQEGALRGPNLIHVITCEGLRIAHLGDLGCPLNEEQKEQLTNLDVLMIPVGGHFTIDADLAADITKSLAPKCAIPMHYRGDGFGYDVLSTVDEYTRHFDNVRKVGNMIEINNDIPEVAVMDFRA
jgi:L-ascorbate metabolism protein UlaG (beta-lactamase superfamily)